MNRNFLFIKTLLLACCITHSCAHFRMSFLNQGPVISSELYDQLVIHKSNMTEQWKKTFFRGKKKKTQLKLAVVLL